MIDRRTKIIATLGPASTGTHTIRKLIEAGANVLRLNFSHGNPDTHAASIARVRKISDELGHPVTLLQDLQGPKIRIGELKGSIKLKPGSQLILTSQPLLGDVHKISIDMPGLQDCVQPGNRILLDDGAMELIVEAVLGEEVYTKVSIGGMIKPNKGVNLPGIILNLPALTEKDEADLAFGLEHGIDVVALSFVRRAQDVESARETIARLSPTRKETPIIAKLERPEALENIHEIIATSDGVMVARGDLGVEMSPQEVPIAQKRIIAIANRHAKLVITATQMLDSMIHSPLPTRAEASDVANAIFDGTDAVMLSGETAIGEYPVQTVEMMASIISQAESHLAEWGHWDGDLGEEAVGSTTLGGVFHDDALSITRAARELAHDRNVTAIVVFTQTGRTAHLMAKARPQVPILAFTPAKSTYQRLPIFWGVIPYLVPFAHTFEEMLRSVENAIISSTSIQPGQQVVLICGFPVDAMCPPNMALLHTIRE